MQNYNHSYNPIGIICEKTRLFFRRQELDSGVVSLVGSNGLRLTLRHNPENDLPTVERNDELWDYQEHMDVYQGDNGVGPISQTWSSGTLAVEAGKQRFTCTVTQDGKATWENHAAQ